MNAGSTLDSTAVAAQPVKCAAAATAAWETKRDNFNQPGHVRFQLCSSLAQNSYGHKKAKECATCLPEYSSVREKLVQLTEEVSDDKHEESYLRETRTCSGSYLVQSTPLRGAAMSVGDRKQEKTF